MFVYFTLMAIIEYNFAKILMESNQIEEIFQIDEINSFVSHIAAGKLYSDLTLLFAVMVSFNELCQGNS